MRYTRDQIYRRIAADAHLRQEILDRIASQSNIRESLRPSPAPTALERPDRAASPPLAPIVVDDVRRLLDTPNAVPRPEDLALEAIILRLGRPVLKIRNDDFDTAELGTDTWAERLAQSRPSLLAPILAVGRIELRNHPSFSWIGTGWLVAEDIIVTNRHVAREFAAREDGRFVFRQYLFGELSARVDFKEEHEVTGAVEYPVVEVLHIEEDSGPDLAFLRLDWSAAPPPAPRVPIVLSAAPAVDQQVAVIGYPAKDTRTSIPEEMDAIFGNVYNVKRLAPGQLIGVFPEQGLLTHDCTTLGGNSGSVVVDLASGAAVGLHFAGREEQANYAVSAPVVRQKLDEVLARLRPAAPPAPQRRAAPTAAELAARTGYDPGFLGPQVPLPVLSAGLQSQVAPVDGRTDGLLHYTHYSVIMHAARRLAVFTACNIDGKQWRQVPRTPDRWYLDPRLPESLQVAGDLYKKNKLDQGHLVRRLDPAWGNTYEDAETAVWDTFFYTNCAPQHQQLNRVLWLGLEDYILGHTDVSDLKVTVFSGPVFRDTDRSYRDLQIPEDFWKVVVMVREETGELSATAYVLSQLDYMDDLEFAFGSYRTYQVPIGEVEQRTGLDFGDLKEHDPLAEREGISFVPLEDLRQISV